MRTALREIKRRVLRPRQDPIASRLGAAARLTLNPARIQLYGESPAERHKCDNRFVHAYYKKLDRFILPGRWDLECGAFKDLERYQFFVELRKHDLDYTKCTRFQTIVRKVRNGEVIKYKNKGVEFRTEEDVHTYMQGHVEVCKSMMKFGYLPDMAEDDICIMVGRSGQLIKEVRGRHRLAIAQVFEIKTIEARIRHVHPIWVNAQWDRLGPVSIDDVLNTSFRMLESEERVLVG